MIDASNQKFDLAIIGAGMAGMAAAVFAAKRGLTTVIMGSLAESWFTGGLIDLMGVHPVESGKSWQDPWAAIDAVVRDIFGHPYAHIPSEDIKAALQEFYALLNDGGRPYRFEDERNSNLITAFGAIKTTHGIPQTMWPGVQALSSKAPCLIADFKGLKGFSADLLVERLKTEWPGLKALSVPSIYGDQVHEINPVPLARDLEIAQYRQKLAELIKAHVKDVEYVGLPAVLGIHRPDQVIDELGELLGKPVFEIPAMPPSIPGMRLKEAFLRFLPANNVHCLFQKQVLKATPTSEGEITLDTGRTEHENSIKAYAVLLSTGRFLGGGLHSDHTTVTEPIFDLPVFQPENRELWHCDRLFEPSGHAINLAGLETDDMLRPLGTGGQPAFENLFAAGIILAHQDWTRMKCGSGLSVATAYGAVKSFSSLRP
ncbi:Anaerobic glycerol-3-phosphate dehydrogenase subunit B (EC [Olavius sp. associated proteobacterium Delta 1]|nr:Anaerobic glycerol-3-phosphate dehydrogenase subunit B (EC [Olavius sp. associated proteobacterium Delta 1]